jgi:hypothetical protein
MFRNPTLRLVSALALTATFAACSGSGGGKSPSAASGPQATIATAYGTVTIYTNGHAFDPTRAVAAIEAGYDRARQQVGSRVDNVRVDGMGISVQPGVFRGAVGQYHTDRDLVEVAQGVENVLTHELQHRFCHKLGRSGDCCTYQDHSGGFDLQCQPR